MRPFSALLKRLASLFRRQQRDVELDAELRSHIEMHAADLMRTGLSREEALRQARIAFGGIERAKEECREAIGISLLESLLQDLRFGARMLRKNPGFTTVAILTLALGIGANTSIFTLVDSVMLRALPVRDPQQLVLFTWHGRWPPSFSQTGADEQFSFSYPQFEEIRQENNVLSSVFAFVPVGFSHENITLNRNGQATSANAMMVTGGYFAGLGAAPLLGRTINDADEKPGARRVAVISYAYWNSQLGRDPAIVGTKIGLNGFPFTVVGVMPPAFFGETVGTHPDYWIAFDDAPNLRPWGAQPLGSDSVYTARDWICLNIMGRLKPGVSQEQAQAALNLIYQRIVAQDWKTAAPRDLPHFSLTPASQGVPFLRELVALPLLLMLGAVGIVLLIACANIATLLLARASGRSKEMAVRLAVGARRGRLVRQLLTESVMLSLAGGAVGFLLAKWGTRALLALPTRGEYAIFVNVSPDVRVLLFTTIAAALTGILFGFAPALRISRIELSVAMKDSAADFLAFRGKHRLGQSLVVAQIAASLVLVIGAGLFLRSLIGLASNNFGFNQTNLLTFGLDPTRDGYEGPRLIALYSELLDRLQALPGVRSATLMEFPPFAGVSSNTQLTIAGGTHMPDNRNVRWQIVGPDFFRTLQIPIVLGRGIGRSDVPSSPKVAVIDQTFAKDFFPNENPIGRHFGFGVNPKTADEFEIIGVAGRAELTDVHSGRLAKAYLCYQQRPDVLNGMYFEVRSVASPEAIVSEIRDAVRQSDPNLPLLSLETQTEIRNDALTGDRIIARFSTLFGILALVLAVIGLYGTISYAIARKAHEIGIRMALGAVPNDVLRMVIAQGLKLATIGIAIGLLAAFGVTRLLRTLIFGITPTDPLTFASVSLLLLIVAVLACYIPARRATRIDPVTAIRCE